MTSMDVDEAHQPDLMSHFGGSPDIFPWRGYVPQDIENRRAAMSDLLIFDILLSSGGIRHPDTLYPPADALALRRLLGAIESSTYDALKKECLIYFLLKWYTDGRAERFKLERCILPHFAMLADAYWYLDTGINVARAVSLLSDPRLNKDYASKILQAISLSENPWPLVLKYVRTSKPILTEPDDIDLYVIALAESTLLEAWQFQRTFPANNETRSRLIRKILEWCLSPKPRPQPLTQLLAFPFSAYEQSLVHEYALHPPSTTASSSVPIIQELVCTRLIQSGQYSAAVKLDRQFSSASTSKPIPKIEKSIQDRRRMMDEILAAMPAERDLLEMELESLTKGKGRPIAASGSRDSFGAGSGDLSMSWEDVQPIRPPVNRSSIPARTGLPPLAPTPPPLPERSGAPLFGSGFPLLSSGSKMQNPLPSQKIFAAPPANSTFNLHHSSNLSSSRGAPVPPVGPTGMSFPTGLFAQSSSTQPILTPASLFGSTASANKTRNAFYEPSATNGNKRTFSQDIPPPQKATVNLLPPTEDDDMNLDSEDGIVRQLRPPENDHPRKNGWEEAELSFSVFSDSGKNTTGPARQRIGRTKAKAQMPPGAFLSDGEEEIEVERTERTTRGNGRGLVTPPPLQPPKQARNARVDKAAVGGTDLGRSIPGSLMVEEEEEEAESDHIAPLPASKRPARRGRTSRAGGYDGEGGDSIQPRRSTRLSAAPSAASSSPESSPKKAPSKLRKNARMSGASDAGGRVKSATRKKR